MPGNSILIKIALARAASFTVGRVKTLREISSRDPSPGAEVTQVLRKNFLHGLSLRSRSPETVCISVWDPVVWTGCYDPVGPSNPEDSHTHTFFCSNSSLFTHSTPRIFTFLSTVIPTWANLPSSLREEVLKISQFHILRQLHMHIATLFLKSSSRSSVPVISWELISVVFIFSFFLEIH